MTLLSLDFPELVTPDLLQDLIGTQVYRPETAEFVVQGPIFANFFCR